MMPIMKLVILTAVAVLSLSLVPSSAQSYNNVQLVGQPLARRSTAMGVDYYLHLFNLKAYHEKVLPAYHLFLRRNDPGPLITLLQEYQHILAAYPHLSEQLLGGRSLAQRILASSQE